MLSLRLFLSLPPFRALPRSPISPRVKPYLSHNFRTNLYYKRAILKRNGALGETNAALSVFPLIEQSNAF